MMLRTLRKRFMPPADDVVTLEHVVPVVPAVPIFRDRSNSSLMAEVDDVEVDDGDSDASDAPPPAVLIIDDVNQKRARRARAFTSYIRWGVKCGKLDRALCSLEVFRAAFYGDACAR